MNKLGIYFGPRVISVVETKDRNAVNIFEIPQIAISPDNLQEEKVPQEIKIATFLKNEFISRRIEVREVNIVLSGKDLIVRTFEMPVLAQKELATAVNFEAKKYTPFKIEDLIADFQYKLDKISRKNSILYVGIKKETLDKYLSIFEQIAFRIRSIEYSAFSILRLLKLVPIKEKGIIGVIGVDFMKNDEINLVVLEDGVPLFTRDITSISGIEGENINTQELQTAAFLEKLKSELLVSLNYYDRKFLGKKIDKIFFLMSPNYQADLLEVFKDIDLNIQFIDIDKYIGRVAPFSLTFIKAYSGSLSEIKTDIKINLLSAKEKSLKKISAKLPVPISLFSLLEPSLKVIIACLLICIGFFLFGSYRQVPIKQEVENIINTRPKISAIILTGTSEELNNLYSNYKAKIAILENLTKRKIYLTKILGLIPRLMPENMWLSGLSFNSTREENRADLKFEGMVYLDDENKEINLLDNFLSNLKKDPIFTQYFKEINISSLDRKQIGKYMATSFVIFCHNENL